MVLVSVDLVSILSGDILLFLFFILPFSMASVYMPDDMMVMLTGHNFVFVLILTAMAPVAGEVVPVLSCITLLFTPMASVPTGLLSMLCMFLLIRGVLISHLVALVPMVLGFSGDIFILFSVVSLAPEMMPTLRGNILVLISVASMAVRGVAKLARCVL